MIAYQTNTSLVYSESGVKSNISEFREQCSFEEKVRREKSVFPGNTKRSCNQTDVLYFVSGIQDVLCCNYSNDEKY